MNHSKLEMAAGVTVLAIALLVSGDQPLDAAGKPRGLPRVPDGFTIEVAAASPLVKHPMLAGFDHRGRLFIAASSGENIRSGDLLKDPPNLIRMIADTDGDGVFDRSTVFADKMTLPMGALWHRGALYVASPPNIWRLRDLDDDGVADERTILVDTFGFSGNAASVHGCFLGPNGRLYWCDGRHGHEFRDKDGQLTSKGKAARIFSCRLDGSDVRTWCGGGMDNPVEVDFLSTGEMIGSVNIFLGRPRVDCLVHWVDGGAYPRFDQACVAEFPKTGPLMPPLARMGHVAVSGMTRYRSTEFGPGFQGNLFTTLFNTHKVARSVVVRDGGTFRTTESDFLVSDDPDFHPTDVLEDADGSLLVIDTGGWFRIGCPVSKVAKPDIHGAIYRIRRRGAHKVKDPRGRFLDAARLTPAALARHLDDARPVVRERVIDRLAQAGSDAIATLESVLAERGSRTHRRRLGAVWALSRIEKDGSLEPLRTALTDESPDVRVAASRSLGTRNDRAAVPRLAELLAGDVSAAVRRQAATALGQILQVAGISGTSEAKSPTIASLLAASARPGIDRFEEHALLYAVIRNNDAAATRPLLSDRRPTVRRAALMALDQMADGKLTREMVVPLLDTDDPSLQTATLEVIGRHEGWATETRALLGTWLAEKTIDANRSAVVRGFLLSQQADTAIQSLVAERLADKSLGVAARQLLIEVVGRSSFEKLPTGWQEVLVASLKHDDPVVREGAVRALASRRLIGPELESLIDDVQQVSSLRVAGMQALADTPVGATRLEFLLQQLDTEIPPLSRLAAARVMASARLTNPQQVQVAARFKTAGPLELPVLLRACPGIDDPRVALAVLDGLESARAVDSLAAADLLESVQRMKEPYHKRGRKLLARVDGKLAARRAELKDTVKELVGGDVARGRAIFFGKKAACSGCHAVGDRGGRVGPALSTIGDIRQPGDLLESIALPSASFARGFRSYTLATQSGRVHTGVISRETTRAIWIKSADLSEVRVPRSHVEAIRESAVSIMPKGLDKILSPGQLGDLIAFLRSCRAGAVTKTTTR